MNSIHVIIPVYNALPFLEDTVNSVLSQPYKGIDILLVDDGSKDGSAGLCDEIAAREERVNVIHKENGGVSSARNAGIEYYLKTTSPDTYIAFLDSDDLWVRGAITDSVIGEINGVKADIVGLSSYVSNTRCTRFQSMNQYTKCFRQFTEPYQNEILWAKGTFAAHIYRIGLFQDFSIRFATDCRLNEDVIFSAKMLFCSQKLLFLDRYLYIYRRNTASVTSTTVYSLENATHIPDSWHRAACFVEQFDDISTEKKAAWYNFCRSTSSIRCLEVISYLAAEGCSEAEVESIFKNREYYHAIETLKPEELASWQRPSLTDYNSNRTNFYKSRKKAGLPRKILRKMPGIKFLKQLLTLKAYRIPLSDIGYQDNSISEDGLS